MRWSGGAVIFFCLFKICFGQAGRLDPTFRPTFDAAVACIVVQPDGNILVSGEFTNVNGQLRQHIARLHPDGSLDMSFVANADRYVRKLILLSGGKILALGSFTTINGVNRLNRARLYPDGAVDESFESDFLQRGSLDFAVEADSKILITGFEGLYRLSPDGILDNLFHVRLNQGGYLTVVHVLPEGEILVAGNFATVNGVRRNDVARLFSDGQVDPAFDTSTVNLGTRTECLLPQPDGKLLVGGSAFTRLLPDGTQDPTFPYSYTNGIIGTVYAMAIQDEAKFVIGGELKGDQNFYGTNLIRYFFNGTADRSFNVGLGSSAPIPAIIIQPDQRILVGGYFRDYDGSGQAYLARVLNDWPVLDSRNVGPDAMELRWPAVYTNFVLQTASSVPSTNWITVTNSPAIISNMFVLTNSTADGNQFFRLVKP